MSDFSLPSKLEIFSSNLGKFIFQHIKWDEMFNRNVNFASSLHSSIAYSNQ